MLVSGATAEHSVLTSGASGVAGPEEGAASGDASAPFFFRGRVVAKCSFVRKIMQAVSEFFYHIITAIGMRLVAHKPLVLPDLTEENISRLVKALGSQNNTFEQDYSVEKKFFMQVFVRILELLNEGELSHAFENGQKLTDQTLSLFWTDVVRSGLSYSLGNGVGEDHISRQRYNLCAAKCAQMTDSDMHEYLQNMLSHIDCAGNTSDTLEDVIRYMVTQRFQSSVFVAMNWASLMSMALMDGAASRWGLLSRLELCGSGKQGVVTMLSRSLSLPTLLFGASSEQSKEHSVSFSIDSAQNEIGSYCRFSDKHPYVENAAGEQLKFAPGAGYDFRAHVGLNIDEITSGSDHSRWLSVQELIISKLDFLPAAQ